MPNCAAAADSRRRERAAQGGEEAHRLVQAGARLSSPRCAPEGPAPRPDPDQNPNPNLTRARPPTPSLPLSLILSRLVAAQSHRGARARPLQGPCTTPCPLGCIPPPPPPPSPPSPPPSPPPLPPPPPSQPPPPWRSLRCWLPEPRTGPPLTLPLALRCILRRTPPRIGWGHHSTFHEALPPLSTSREALRPPRETPPEGPLASSSARVLARESRWPLGRPARLRARSRPTSALLVDGLPIAPLPATALPLDGPSITSLSAAALPAGGPPIAPPGHSQPSPRTCLTSTAAGRPAGGSR